MPRARKRLNDCEGPDELPASDSEEEYEVCSEAESVDSAEEEAFQQGLDLAVDMEEENTALLATPPKPTRWRNTDEDDVLPVQHPFAPVRTPGVQLDGHQQHTPLELFQLFFDKAAIRDLCNNTNLYTEAKKKKGMKMQWSPVTPLEMHKFLGLIIYNGLIKATRVQDVWRNDRLHSFPFPASVMPGHRFWAIFCNLHMSNTKEDEENDRLKGTAGYDRLCRVKPLMGQLLLACKAYYQPHQNLAIDERMVATKARMGLKQYMKQKAPVCGSKLFVLADSRNGYTSNFSIYQGRGQSRSGKGLSYDTVMDLLTSSSLGTGYHVYMDNFYTSPALFWDLHKNRYGACGTIWENRIGFSKTTNALPKRAARGDIRWIRTGPLLYVKWIDVQEVTVCSTIHKAYSGETIQRRLKNPDGTWSVQAIPVPDAVKEYNEYMGGVDLSDALIEHFTVSKKTMEWYRKLFLHFVDIAVVNSYIIHKELMQDKQQKTLTQNKFREILCQQLVDFGSNEATTPKKLAPELVEVLQDLERKPCYPVTIVDTSASAKRDRASAGRRHCLLCLQRKKYSKTIYKCGYCDVALCIMADRLCFTEWHELMDS
ncbi:piggyBac transposable element-derived protein 4 [Ictalurus furcatus]|uniref:piggyBac transposable element-derived protein 4 n=1 Tax=Ictalurus furcatus TaxID=66913 RepID=UPI0023501288|nr:piggyBac transposable element-derived protein 4 [Ictalurus furcatus]